MPTELTLSPQVSGAIAERNRAAQAMALRVGETGSSQYTPEVEAYQLVWNATRAATREQAMIVGLSRQQALAITPFLEVDGRFGPNTSGTLCTIVGSPCPPARAPGMPTWVAQNADRLMALVPPSGPPVEEMIDPAPSQIVPPNTNPQPDVRSGSSVVQVTVRETTESGPSRPAPIPSPGPIEEQLAADLPVPVTPIVQEEVIDFSEPGLETPIISTRPSSRAPMIAVLLGAGALGGAFWWFQYGRKGRRA